MLVSHPDRCAHWAQTLAQVPVPVLRETRDALARWEQMADRADANSLADTVLRDPLMTLRVFACVSQRFGERLSTPVETVTGAIVLLGIEPFFALMADLPVLEDRLAGNPPALAGALHAIERSHRAARLAAAFAIQRQDEDVEVLHQAALLDNFAGLLLWCEAPRLVLDMAQRQQADPALRSADVQRLVLGVDLPSVEHALVAQWGLPDFLREMSDPGLSARPGPRSVMLAVRIARHSQGGWHNAALPDDYAELGHLLNLSQGAVVQLVREICGDN